MPLMEGPFNIVLTTMAALGFCSPLKVFLLHKFAQFNEVRVASHNACKPVIGQWSGKNCEQMAKH
jgi:hypothetical protein